MFSSGRCVVCPIISFICRWLVPDHMLWQHGGLLSLPYLLLSFIPLCYPRVDLSHSTLSPTIVTNLPSTNTTCNQQLPNMTKPERDKQTTNHYQWLACTKKYTQEKHFFFLKKLISRCVAVCLICKVSWNHFGRKSKWENYTADTSEGRGRFLDRLTQAFVDKRHRVFSE